MILILVSSAVIIVLGESKVAFSKGFEVCSVKNTGRKYTIMKERYDFINTNLMDFFQPIVTIEKEINH